MAPAKKAVVMIYAAGSLRHVLPSLVSAFQSISGVTAETRLGPAGLLRERIEAGERPDIFLSASFAHPARLAELKLAWPAVVFARNTMAAAVRRDASITTRNFVDRLLDPAIGIATSTASGKRAPVASSNTPLAPSARSVSPLRRKAELNAPDKATFYGGDAKGYTDYPTAA